jgi:nitrogen regulatory protein P-II 1
MKLITAIVQSERLDDLVQSVIDSGAHGMTVTEARGFGRQYGKLAVAKAAAGWASDRKAALLPKIRMEIVAGDGDAETVMNAIAKRANTGTIGDGKIWVTPVDSVLRVRTGDRDDDAV